MNTYIPEFKALWMAENIIGGMHNLYTLRGAPVRDGLRWSQYINNALFKFGEQAEVMFTAHHWPRWGNKRIKEVLRDQRDLYANLHNQVLHLANMGVTINQIHNVFELPKSIQNEWHLRGYHGSVQHNARGVVQRYLGFWDCNPATLLPPSPEDSAPLFIRMMGGASKITAEGRSLYDKGDYRLAVEILNKLVCGEPHNAEAKDLLADAFEQIGYQQENPGLRNSFLAGAYELRSGAPKVAAVKSSSADVVRAMPTDLFLNFLGVRLDSRKAEHDQFTINLVTPDNGEMYAVELRNATLTNIKGFQHQQADLTLTVARADLELAMMGAQSPEQLIASGKAKIAGDISVLKRLGAMMADFDPTFEIMPGTKQGATHLEPHKTPEAADIGDSVPE
jgi:alkyl sulfatase BDS1-like metallo-beta-lactamase superfamily hydrolase